MRPLLLRRTWRELLEHFRNVLIQVLNVFVGVIGERVARVASPNQLLRFCVEQIDDQRSYLICFCCCGCLTKTSKTSASKPSPTPTSSKPIVEGIQGLLIVCDLHRHDGN